MVFSSTPLISISNRSAPQPMRCDSSAKYQRRWSSSRRLRNKVRLIMSLSVRMGFASAAWATLAGVDRLGWHPSVLHRRSMAALYANRPLDRKSPNPGGNCFTRPKARVVKFARDEMMLNPIEGDALWTVRNTLMHSFGLYDQKTSQRVIATDHCRISR